MSKHTWFILGLLGFFAFWYWGFSTVLDEAKQKRMRNEQSTINSMGVL